MYWQYRPPPHLRLPAQATIARGAPLNVARSIYGHQPAVSPLWSAPGVFTLLDAPRRDALLPLLSAP